ncbi:hypothetical protein C5972_09140 [Cronobacter sakazakii]|nr:hypothetical protein C5937_19660 [Cronobacter sakazakii]PQZ20473.1 hypothetical protein C5972_09140 [Cronobacter sakazakii]HAV6908208.1 hypothetical protein [Cronobacter sakazakii]
MKGSSSPMKNKLGAQKGALIKMKQENMYIYQWLYRLCYVPIIAPLTLLTLLTLVVLIITLFNVFSCKVCPRF